MSVDNNLTQMGPIYTNVVQKQSLDATPIGKSNVVQKQSLDPTPIGKSNVVQKQSLDATPIGKSSVVQKQSLDATPIGKSNVVQKQSLDATPITKSNVLRKQFLDATPIVKSNVLQKQSLDPAPPGELNRNENIKSGALGSQANGPARPAPPKKCGSKPGVDSLTTNIDAQSDSDDVEVNIKNLRSKFETESTSVNSAAMASKKVRTGVPGKPALPKKVPSISNANGVQRKV